ncbi:MAG TPA: hypothetical protein V6C58_05575, partial [Allocoleopsis sp.]
MNYTIFQPTQSIIEIEQGENNEILLVRYQNANSRNQKEKGKVVAKFKQIGPGSRIMPGLVGIEEIPLQK